MRGAESDNGSEQKVFREGCEKALRELIKRKLGRIMPRRTTWSKISRGSGNIATAFVGIIFSIYGFLAFTNPDQYPVLRKVIEYPTIYSIDPYLGLGLLVIGLVLIYMSR